MAEEHHIAGVARGEPLPPDHVGVRVRVPLSGAPTSRWARFLSAHLVTELTGHRAVGHLHVDDCVQGTEIVLDGVEEPEADCLGEVISRAVAAANRASRKADTEPRHGNMAPEEAERIARKVTASAPGLAPQL